MYVGEGYYTHADGNVDLHVSDIKIQHQMNENQFLTGNCKIKWWCLKLSLQYPCTWTDYTLLGLFYWQTTTCITWYGGKRRGGN
jgi:hypothetical protein